MFVILSRGQCQAGRNRCFIGKPAKSIVLDSTVTNPTGALAKADYLPLSRKVVGKQTLLLSSAYDCVMWSLGAQRTTFYGSYFMFQASNVRSALNL